MNLVTYEFAVTSVSVSAETVIGVISANNTNDLEVVAVEAMVVDSATSNPPVTWRLRAYTGTASGTAVVGQKDDRRSAAAITSRGQAVSTGLTADTGSPQDSATIGYNAPFYKTYPDAFNGDRLIVKSGESIGLTVERNGAAATMTVRGTITVRE